MKITYYDEIVENEDKIQVYFCVPEASIDGMNGIAFAEAIRMINRKAIIVFVSENMIAVGEILKRYICPAAYFLLDEIDNMTEYVIRVVNRLERAMIKSNIKLELVSKYEKVEVSLNSVLYFVSGNKKIQCNLENGKKIEFYGTLSAIEKKYENFFVRCHSGYLVNKQKIAELHYTKNYMLLFDSEERIPISRKYKQDVKRFFNV